MSAAKKMTEDQRDEVSDCDECMSAKCSVCGHEPCPCCVDDCDHFDCIEWNEKTGSGKKKHVCVFPRCAKHAEFPRVAW